MDVTVVLFDIDGTLLDVRGAGRAAFVRTLEAVFGWQDEIRYIQFAGNTDLNVLQQVMDRHGRPMTEADSRRFFDHFPRELACAAREVELILYPGVRDLLEALSADDAVVLGLVTGNIEGCARIKLQQFDLHHHFVLGAFGNEHADRNDIARLALSRVKASLTPGQRIRAVFLIGDTPFDIAAAKSIGATAVAVATGRFTVNDLRAAGADLAVEDLSDTSSLIGVMKADGRQTV
jgi:phosphoglycolate phosphatase-like HAD superfamily hydrolase